jgi:glutamyl-Q tRNA(Asp) synthetase
MMTVQLASHSAEMREISVFRFAPSPNGRLHLGHAFSALFTERAAASAGGTFLLRLEDIDPQRCTPQFEAGIFEDLSWLGLTWPQPVMRQSARTAAYTEAAGALKSRGLLYPCFCSRQEIVRAAIAADPDGAPVYTGNCRRLSPGQAFERLDRGERAQWRIKMDRATAESGPIMISEAPARGTNALWSKTKDRVSDPMRWGDAVLIRKDTPTSYHLSVTVDDAAQGVTHVTRGTDLFAVTDLHVLLQRLLGLPSPVYCHHQLLHDDDGEKLAKSKGAVSLNTLRESGVSVTDVRRKLGFEGFEG